MALARSKSQQLLSFVNGPFINVFAKSADGSATAQARAVSMGVQKELRRKIADELDKSDIWRFKCACLLALTLWPYYGVYIRSPPPTLYSSMSL